MKLGSRLALELVADKWAASIVHVLIAGKKRDNELRRGVPGISQRMLTLTLRNLECAGLVERNVCPVVPPENGIRVNRAGAQRHCAASGPQLVGGTALRTDPRASTAPRVPGRPGRHL